MAFRPGTARFLFGALGTLLVASAAAAAPATGSEGALQEPATCKTSVSPAFFSFSAAGGTGSLALELTAGCPLSVAPDVAWIHVAPPSVGGTAATPSIAFLVDENTTSASRS